MFFLNLRIIVNAWFNFRVRDFCQYNLRVSRQRDCSLEGACQGHAHFPDTEYLKRVTADRTVAGPEYFNARNVNNH